MSRSVDPMKKKVLFLCTHNSCRSQMAQAILRHHFPDRYEAFSAGTEATSVDPGAVLALKERGIETSGLWSKSVEEYIGSEFDEVVTVCDHAREACPFFPGARSYTHQGFLDPPALVSGGMGPKEAFRKVLDDIEAWIIERYA